MNVSKSKKQKCRAAEIQYTIVKANHGTKRKKKMSNYKQAYYYIFTSSVIKYISLFLSVS